MSRKVRNAVTVLALIAAMAPAFAASDKAAEHSQGPAHANPNAGGFSNPSSVLYNNVSEVPEPGTWALALAGAGVVAWSMRRRSQ
ncbi:MAG: PEP-CTERM sorting domain-containing protein [Proteobacteria bacterium]|uniref:PEP-CTERM sorting domain-containing protein n=1 Tax=Aquabacterium sp. TaxID=1872578 RepID=UPI0035C72E92|nr:PEP-CTERM sorting domain-containing protein [Pseudomonadota bacterium]